LYFESERYSNSKDITSEKYLSQIIYSQKNLLKILFENINLHHSLTTLKHSNCSNTLKTIIFWNIDFNNLTNLNQVFENLNVLESVHILYCLSLNSEFIQQILNITKPFKLKSLFMNEVAFQIETFHSLLQKSGYYLEN